MAKDKFILVSLKEDESKKLAQIITNQTSRKILDYLSEKEATESELAEKLGVPISTIHYNLSALTKAKMVEADEYHYSEKGREVLHYKLANKYIVIAPKSTFGIKEKLKKILPVGLLAVAGSFIVYLYDLQSKTFGKTEAALTRDMAPKMMVAESANTVVQQDFWQIFLENPALWFLSGCVFTLILIVIVEFIVYKRQK